MHAALAVLLGLNGLRVSGACGANAENHGFERGHRILQIVGKGKKPAGIPLVPRTARTLDLGDGGRGGSGQFGVPFRIVRAQFALVDRTFASAM